jgi:hypothetical protein
MISLRSLIGFGVVETNCRGFLPRRSPNCRLSQVVRTLRQAHNSSAQRPELRAVQPFRLLAREERRNDAALPRQPMLARLEGRPIAVRSNGEEATRPRPSRPSRRPPSALPARYGQRSRPQQGPAPIRPPPLSFPLPGRPDRGMSTSRPEAAVARGARSIASPSRSHRRCARRAKRQAASAGGPPGHSTGPQAPVSHPAAPSARKERRRRAPQDPGCAGRRRCRPAPGGACAPPCKRLSGGARLGLTRDAPWEHHFFKSFRRKGLG